MTATRPHTQLTIAGQAITYDANGNMTADGTRTFTWNVGMATQKNHVGERWDAETGCSTSMPDTWIRSWAGSFKPMIGHRDGVR